MEFLSSMTSAFTHGGNWMWAILVIQIMSFAIIVERTIALYFTRKIECKDLITAFEAEIKRGELDKVLVKAEAMTKVNPLGAVVVAGTQAALNLGGQNEVQAKMDEVLLEQNSYLEKRTGFLAMFANVGTLTGLLGTVTGMIKSFAAVSVANPMEKATLLSLGISEAMNATAYGLIMAIPALFFYGVLQNRANALAEDLNQASLKIFNWLTYSFENVAIKPALRSQKQAATQSHELKIN